ncbi:hypothetical protein B0T17DRAFT_613985 [Bombardia bombarda]|uniref:Polyketide synthase n=1 Tax=Bombardia bombarda TaxID=252184 RepID=A0AA40CGA4_9PEZI|nr:hypothetical protein B0T17DRAFT_613985 [Bombardia bombarda]
MDYSFAVFGPQGVAPTVVYLLSLRAYIANHPVLRCIVEEISTLQDVWNLVASNNKKIAALPQAPKYMHAFTEWLIDGNPEAIVSTASSITTLPRLCIIHVVQYFQFLESRGISHIDFIGQVRKSGGGLQGYCGGLPATAALSSALDDQEIARNIMTAIRLSFAIGLYTELGDDTRVPGLAIMVVRVEREEQAQALVDKFPKTYISAFTDPRNISVVGPTEPLEALKAYATEQGYLVQPLEIRGKVHNPENTDLAHELSSLCSKSELLSLPSSDCLQCPMRSNRNGAVIPPGTPLSDDVLYTILSARSEWYLVLEDVARSLKKTGVQNHEIISLGIGDFIPLMPFNKLGLRAKKTEWNVLEEKERSSSSNEHTQPIPPYTYPDDAIAIVGASCRLPGANNMEELWEVISTGQDTHEELKANRFNMYGGYRAFQSGKFAKNRKWYGNFVEGVDRFDRAFFGANAREMANMDPQQRMLLELAYEAMESYGYTKSHVRSSGDNVGCFIGASFTEYLENAYSHAPTAYTAPGTIRAFLCGRISYYFGWTGPSEVIDTACSASLVAVNRAVRAIRGGECPVAIAGGVNIISGVHNYLDLARAGFLSATGQCKPWDKDADGYCRSDGVGLVVLKSLKQAQADGDRIMAVITGAATNQGGLSSSITNPDPVQQARLYREVLNQSALTPEQVTYVEAHGTGTQAGDKIETSSLREVFGSPARPSDLTIGSIKGNIGHCETAAGVAGLLKVIPSLEPDRMTVSRSLKPWDTPFRASLVNSFGAAGSNATVVCCEAPRPTGPRKLPLPSGSDYKRPILLSAQSTSSLQSFKTELAKHLSKSLGSHKSLHIDELAYTLSEKRRHHRHVMVLEASSAEELANMLSDEGDQPPIAEADDATASKKPVVLVFGGQSKQFIGVGKDMYTNFATFRNHIDVCDAFLQELGYPSIVPAIFLADESLDNIVTLQTGHVAVQYASACTWIEAGLHIDAVIGHSLGELSALAISGRLSIHDCLRLVAERASLMQKRWGADKGAMVAVFATRQAVEAAIASVGGSTTGNFKLEIACYNSETSQVVSGDTGSVAELESHLSKRQVKYVRVETSHAFHSRLVEPVLEELNLVSASLEWRAPTIPIELCVATPLAPEVDYSPSKHARDPVFFSDAVHRLERELGNDCIWLEAGIDTPIMPMTKRAALHSQHTLLGVSTKEAHTASNAITRAVAKLWKAGIPVTHWSFLHSKGVLEPVWLPPYAFDRTTAWLDNIDHAASLQRQLDELPQTDLVLRSTEIQLAQTSRMVSALLETEAEKLSGTKRFRVAVEGKRFQTIVAGHAVRGRPLCPASVYLECATMALQQVVGDNELQQSSLEFQGLDIQAPLGLAPDQQVEVVLSQTQGHQCSFAIVSRHPTRPNKTTLHAKGVLARSVEASDSQLDVMARLVERNMLAIESTSTERMMAGRVYKLFSRVVDYGKVLQGISSMAISGSEAAATIVLSPLESRPGADESTVLPICDAVVLDSFIQVVGLAMNTSDSVGTGEVMICNGIDSSVVAKNFDFAGCASYRVYASYTQTPGTNKVMGDVFAWSDDGRIVAAFIGCRFVKLDITRLEKALDPANRAPGIGNIPKLAQAQLAHSPPAILFPAESLRLPKAAESSYGSSSSGSDHGLTTAQTTPGILTPPLVTENRDIRLLLESYTGASATMMTSDVIISDLGLDSLASTELASELQPVNGRPITSEDLVTMTVGQLEERIYGGRAKSLTPANVVTLQQHVAPLPVAVPATMPVSVSTSAVQSTVYASPSPKEATASAGINLSNKVTELLVETTGIDPSMIQPQATLQEVGVDSLALTEILTILAEFCLNEIKTDDISVESRVSDILRAIGAQSGLVAL